MSSYSTSQAGLAMPTLSITTLFTLAALFVQVSAQGWILPMMPALAVTRMDPIVNPGAVASHVHNVVGGSNFDNIIHDPEFQQQSDCSSTTLQSDKSMYWAPQVYYRRTDNTLVPMLGNSRIYYFIKGDVKPFPPNLRMVSGTAMGRNTSAYASKGLRMSCSGGDRISFLPNSTSHPEGCGGMSLGIFFPSCGLADGSLDSDDHFSHMAWPITASGGGLPGYPDPNTGGCPESHPIKYPTIFMEHNYYFAGEQPWRNEENLVVLSNGDTLGPSYHGDFINGWDQDILTEAIKSCRTTDDLTKCSMFKPDVSVPTARACRLQSKIPSENVGFNEPLKELPGCNPLWTKDMDEKPTCEKKPDEPGFVYPNAYATNLQFYVNLPIADPEAVDSLLTNRFYPDNYQALAPTWIGKLKESAIKRWGPQAGGKTLPRSTIAEILAAWVGDDGVRGSMTGVNGTTNGTTTSPSDNVSGGASASASVTSSKASVSLPSGSSAVSTSSAASAPSAASSSSTPTSQANIGNNAGPSSAGMVLIGQPSSFAKSTAKAVASGAKASSASTVKASSSSKSTASSAKSSGTAKPTSSSTSCKRSKKRSTHAKRRLNMKKRRHTARFNEE